MRLVPVGRAFYARPVLEVARACLGLVLVHEAPDGRRAGRIVETEAYRGPEDLAAHSANGRRTPRTEVMFGPPGHAYLYRLYGHWAFNIVTSRAGEPHAVLVRALEPLVGVAAMAAARGLPPDDPGVANGPGKLCQALALGAEHYGMDLCKSRLFLARGPLGVGPIARSARVGIDYAGAWAARPWRFFERGNACVSRGRPTVGSGDASARAKSRTA